MPNRKRGKPAIHPVGAALFKYRAAKRLDLRSVASKIGISAETLRRLEGGGKSFPITIESARQYLEKKKIRVAA